MCGRIEYFVTNTEILEDHYGAKLVEGYTEQGFNYPRYNIPPTAHTPVVTSESTEQIDIGHWGYLPSWAKDRKSAKEVINARAETILERPYFKTAIEKRRCLIPVTGYFEWKRQGAKKIPYRFHMQGELFSLAGIYNKITDEDGFSLPHYAIVTTEANELMAPIHNRMPVVIRREQEMDWLDGTMSSDNLFDFFKPREIKDLERYEISTLVNNPRNDRSEVLQPA